MKKWFFCYLREEKGNILILVAVMMVVFISFTALVIDGGRLYFEKSMLQKAADAGALAGAQELPQNEVSSKTIAINTAQENFAHRTLSEIDEVKEVEVKYTEEDKWIKVTTSHNVGLTFGKIFGIPNVPITAFAKVQLNPITSAKGVFPLGVNKDLFPSLKNCNAIKLKIKNNGETNIECNGSEFGVGNTTILDVNGNGKDDTKDEFENGSKEAIPLNKELSTITGARVGQIDVSVGRVVTVPMFTDYSYGAGGNRVESVIVKGFATFLITEVAAPSTGKEVKGRFIEFTASGDSSPTQPNYGAYGYKLVE